MPRKPEPFVHEGWYKTDACGVRTKLCPEEMGVKHAEMCLQGHLYKR